MSLWSVYTNIERPLVPILARMEATGVLLDAPHAQATLDELEKATAHADFIVRWKLGVFFSHPTFKVSSHEQLGRRLEVLGAPIKARTPSKKVMKTDEDTLQEVRLWNPPLIDSILAFRKYQKFSGYVSSYLTLVAQDGRVHASFNQAGHYEESGGDAKSAPITGRLSSSGPNLQNIPHHSDEAWGARIRSCFVPHPSWVWVSADVEQEEPRIIALIANDTVLKEAFDAGTDIYRSPTVALYPHTDRPDMDDAEWKVAFTPQRYVGKTFFLAWYYGAGEGRLGSLDPALSSARARFALRQLAKSHPARQDYLARVREEVERNEYVEDMFGRRRYNHKWVRRGGKTVITEEGLRECANMLVQGPAGSILKLAMVRVNDTLEGKSMISRMVSVVHDEINFEAPVEEVDELVNIVYNGFQVVDGLHLPVEAKTGTSWGSVK